MALRMRVGCHIISNTPTMQFVGAAKSIDVSDGDIVQDVYHSLENMSKERLKEISPDDVIVWKLKTPLDLPGTKKKKSELAARLRFFDDELSDEQANADGPICEEINMLFEIKKGPAYEWSGTKICLLFQVPGDAADAQIAAVLNTEMAQKYAQLFIKVHAKRWLQRDDFTSNDLGEAVIEVPEFVKQFEAVLGRKRFLPPNVMQMSDSEAVNQAMNPCYEELNRDSRDPQEAEQSAKMLESTQALLLGYTNWQKLWRPGAVKESVVYAMFVYAMHLHIQEKAGKVESTLSTFEWPFPLVLQTISDGKFYIYRPRSDFLLTRSSLPRLIVEINSGAAGVVHPPDCDRMLLQGVYVVRMANTLEEFKEKKDFVFVALYFHANGEAWRYFLYEQNNEVQYKKKVISLDAADGRVELLRQMFNLIDWQEEYSTDHDEDTKNQIKEMKRAIDFAKSQCGIPSFNAIKNDTKKDTENSRKRSRLNEDSNVDCSDEECKYLIALAECGYDHALERKYPSRIHQVCLRSNRDQRCIAKRIWRNSHEFDILSTLNSIVPGHKNIIRLFDSFHDKSSSLWIILPELKPVEECNFQTNPAMADGICQGIIAGLAYLHGLLIAHRDVKPQNIVVDDSSVPKIIDFDVAIELQDVEEKVSDYCGTHGWIAPEIKEEEGRPSYSPIRSDRWACGKVVLHFLDMAAIGGGGLRTFAEQLMAKEPTKRPLLYEWSQQTSGDKPAHFAARPHSPDALPVAKKRCLDIGQPRFQHPQLDVPLNAVGMTRMGIQVE